MSSSLRSVSFETQNVVASGAFWAVLLGRKTVDEPGAVLVPGTPTQVGLRFLQARTNKSGPNRLHLHLTSVTVEDQRQTVQSALDAGGHRRGSGPLPFGRDLYLTDPGDGELCVIEPGNAYLAGCGPLGEVTCDGSPTAGHFWLAALGWSLVWDKDEQIAIQSPAGGTKISWDGQSEPDAPGWNRQRFDLVTTELEPEIQRLVGLGATLLPARPGPITLADPDGSEFSLVQV